MKTVLLIYIITQLITDAYGLAVIESVRPFVEKRLHDEGYHKNKNSLYRFNNTLSNILKGFIPFYYLTKALNIVRSKGDIESQVNDEIKTKNYITEEDEIIKVDEETEDKTNSIFKDLNAIEFEKPEVYTARKNEEDYYDIYEEEIDYATVEAKKEDNLEISPFVSDDKVVEHVVVKNEVTNKDVARKLCELSADELYALAETLKKLERSKRNTKSLKLEKDVA